MQKTKYLTGGLLAIEIDENGNENLLNLLVESTNTNFPDLQRVFP